MIALDTNFFLIAVPAVIFAGISKAGFGSGAAFASASILALVLPPGQALGIMLPLLMLVDVFSLKPYWGKWAKPEARALILGGLPGVALGIALWRVANDDMLRFLIGAVSLAFVAWQLAKARGLIRIRKGAGSSWIGYLAGTVAGFTSFVSHAGGPPAAVYLLSRGLEKTTYQATTVLVFWVINVAKFVPYAFLGIFTVETLMIDLYLIPAALVGTWLGVYAHRFVSESVFFAITYVLLSLTGSKLIWDALT
ncbi:sulfite exporter TauE/SafE family protein [Primorskyibacter sp. S187A]|uniref:sulfite exporter TauE/SafE family protein n=1 Tax=Primorskyibacter sp. S187A TaxID=3415130 RepID=UPI003C7B543D